MNTKLFTLLLALSSGGTITAQSFSVDDVNYEITSKDKLEVQVTGGSTTASSITIPDVVSFEGKDYRVTSIYGMSFSGYTKLDEIYIGNNVATIGENAFSNCSSLDKVVIGDGLKEIKESAFFQCGSLKEINISPSVETIGDYAFCLCSDLKDITISDAVSYIGKLAFHDCYSLSSIDVSSGNKSFVSVDGVLYNYDKTTLIKYPQGKSDKTFSVPEGVKRIEERALNNAPYLEEAYISASVEEIGDLAFTVSDRLKAINVTSDNQHFTSDNGILFTKDKSTLICYPRNKTDITSYTVPAETEQIEGWAFYGCHTLTDIKLPENISTIADRTFMYCIGLKNINIPREVTNIGSEAFKRCISLEQIKLPNKVATIGNEAFCTCSKISTIEFPASIVSIGDYAFSGTYLTSIYCNATVPPMITSYTFENTDPNIPIYVPFDYISDYEMAIGWSSFMNYQEIPASIQSTEMSEGINFDGSRIINPEKAIISIFDMSGRMVYKGKDSEMSMPSGTYILNTAKGYTCKVTF